MINELEKALTTLRQNKPLILCLTNFVTVDFVANSLLVLGAAPIMSNSQDEIEEIILNAAAVYINIGTLDQNSMSLSLNAARLANKYKKPVILDPVGAGATSLRTQSAKEFLPFANIIRGNSSEILSLSNNKSYSSGVESMQPTAKAETAALELAQNFDMTIMVSGAEDLITNGRRLENIIFGTHLMQKVTGMGCCLTASIAAFNASIKDRFQATYLAGLYFALCGQVAAIESKSPGSFKATFLDQLYQPNLSIMKKIYSTYESKKYV